MGRRAERRRGLRLAHPAEGVALGVAGLLVAATLTISLGGLPDPSGSETTADGTATVAAGAGAGDEVQGSAQSDAAAASAAASAAVAARAAYGPVQAQRLALVLTKNPPLAPAVSAKAVELPGVGVVTAEVAATQPWLLPPEEPQGVASPSSTSTAGADPTGAPSPGDPDSGRTTGSSEAPSSAPASRPAHTSEQDPTTPAAGTPSTSTGASGGGASLVAPGGDRAGGAVGSGASTGAGDSPAAGTGGAGDAVTPLSAPAGSTGPGGEPTTSTAASSAASAGASDHSS